MNKKRQISIPDIIACNLEKNDQILIVFGTSIPGTTGQQMTIQVPTSGNRRWVRWEFERSFGGQLCREYLYQKLLKSGHPSSSYN